jgi:MFS family permease
MELIPGMNSTSRRAEQPRFPGLVLGAAGRTLALLQSTSGEWFPQQRGLITGVVIAGGALGQGLLPFAGRFLIEGFGWRPLGPISKSGQEGT